MSTTHYNFPTIAGSDVIDGVNAINGLANAVDTTVYAVDSAASAAASAAEAAATAAASATSTANAASTNATAAQQTAGQAVTTANAAQSTAAAASSAAQAAANMFVMANSDTVTSGLSVTGFQEYTFTLKSNVAQTAFEFGGRMYKALTAGTVNLVAVPGGSGDCAYGCATGLTMDESPASAMLFKDAGIYMANTGSSVTRAYPISFCIGTDGQVYIFASSSASAQTFASSSDLSVTFIPCAHFYAA